MARQSSGAISFSTQNDGTTPVTFTISNEAHQFPADNAGLVAAATFGSYETTVAVFEGTTRLGFSAASTDTAMANGTFRLAQNTGNNTNRIVYSGTSTNWPAITNYVVTSSTAGALIAASDAAVPTNAVDGTTLRIHIRAKTSTGAIVSTFTDITFSKSIQGAGGNVIDIIGTAETFTANFSGAADSGQDNIILTITNQGTPGNYTVQTALDGGSPVTRTTTGTGAGQIAAFDVDTAGTVSTFGNFPNTFARLAIASTALGNSNNELQVIITGAAGGSDTLSIKKLRRGQGGITVVINAAGGTTFGQGQTAGRVTTATVYDDDTGGAITANLSYNWRENTVSGAQVNVTSSGTRTVVQSGGTPANGTGFANITIDRVDAVDNSNYVCIVTES